MGKCDYSKEFKLKVSKEAILPENKGLEHVIARKYGILPGTVVRWAETLRNLGEEEAFRKKKKVKMTKREAELEKENAKLREEVEILKKAAAFLADLRRG